MRQGYYMGIHMAHLVIVVFRQQWLEVGARVDSAIQAPEDVFATPREDDLVLQGALLPFLKSQQHTMTPPWADRFGRDEMPDFHRRHGGLGADRELDGDTIPFKRPQRRHLASQRENGLILGQTTVQ